MKKTHTLERADVIVLSLPTATDEAAQREIERQLPPDFRGAAWARSADRVAVWPADRRQKAETLFSSEGWIMDGAKLAPGILPGSDPLWIVPAPRWTLETVQHALAQRGRLFVAAAAGLLAVGLSVGRAADAVEEKIGQSERERRALASAQRQDRPTPNRLPLLTHLSAAVPKNAHLVELSIDEATREARLRGRAADYAAVSAFADALATSPTVATVKPGRSNLVKIGGRQVVEFTLEATLK